MSGKKDRTIPPPPSSSGGPPLSFNARPHESSLGDMPTMESAPPSGNFTFAADNNTSSSTLNVLPPPPPPPPPKIRTTTTPNNSVLSPPRSGNWRLPPPPTIGATSSSSSGSSGAAAVPPLPPPPKVAVASAPAPASQAMLRTPPPPMMMNPLTVGKTGPPPPPPRLPSSRTTTTTNNNNNNPPSLADESADWGNITTSGADEDETNSYYNASHPPPRLPLQTFLPPLDPQKGPSLLARRHTHIPILVISTESAQRIAWKNGLQLVDLFQGIVQEAQFGTILPPFRSIHNKSLTLKALPVEFVDPSQLTPSTYSKAHSLLQEHARLQASDGNVAQELVLLEDRVDLLLQDPTESETKEDLSQVAKDAYQLTSPLDIPWLIRYRYALDASTNALPHDLIQCPPLVLLVCSTDEVESPVRVLQELYNAPHILPDAFKNGLYDPSAGAMRHEVLVLHDNVEGPPNVDDAKLRSTLQSQFGPHAQVLRINNVPHDVALALADEETYDAWGGGGRLGTRLSVNDRVLLRRYLQTLLTSALLPALERRIADLNAIVSERKKGVRNLVKSFWRKPKEETREVTSLDLSTSAQVTNNMQSLANNATKNPSNGDNMAMLVQYRYDSIESQTRLLADTLFLIQDYDSALATYRLIRDDFKSDKALVHYASVQEMMALCLYHIDTYGRSKEIFSYLETALLSYTRAAEEERRAMMMGKDPSARPTTAPHATRLATRLCLLLATASDALTKGRELEVADLLASASSHESSLGAAVLLEQASAFYHEAAMYRKYAFHMLMSGHMFRTANQDHHAFRCFTSALYIYRHGKWAELHNHLKSALAAQLYSMGRMSVAMALYAKLVGGAGKVSSKSQQKFLAHLLEICVQHPKAALAGADRMAAAIPTTSNASTTTTLTARERDAARTEYLDRIVQVIQYTPGASRVLELPHVNLPHIVDTSVRIWTHAEDHYFIADTNTENNSSSAISPATPQTPTNYGMSIEMVAQDTSSSSSDLLMGRRPLGKSLKGDDSIWSDLELLATAEWNAVDSNTARGLEDSVTEALSKIQDPQHRRVIAQIDKEKQSQALMERSRRKGTIRPQPATRACREPIFCEFVLQNPMSVAISLTELQLVARLVDTTTDSICTNQDAIRMPTNNDDKDNNDKTWTFPSTENQSFTVAEFCRIGEKNQMKWVSANENPFFVVTKENLELAGEAERVVSVGLTPLMEGDLEILGVRCKLADQVWVYHPFDIPGPLLNDTRSNRANRVRGESLVLKSKISVDMPCLTAELVRRASSTTTNASSTTASSSSSVVADSDDGPLLEGQISSWTLRLRNVGSAPACQPILKTNLPWINIPHQNSSTTSSDQGMSDEELECRATSNCIGPSGTLMHLSLEGNHLQEAGTIHSGETVDIPIQIRTSGTGRRHFYMLYRYALYDEDAPDNAGRTRWLRKMYEVPVFPSLALTARVVASFRKENEQMLSVELTNNRTDRPTDLYVTLDKLSLASRQYRLEVLPGQFSTSEQVAGVLQIGWQERLTVHYRVIPLEGGDKKKCKLSECPFVENAESSSQDCVKSDAMDFLCLERACETFEAAWTSHQNELIRAEHDQDGGGNHPRSIASIRRANTSDSSAMPDFQESDIEIQPTSIEKLCPPESSASDVHILCNWRAILGDEVIRGEHHLRAIPIRPKNYPLKGEGCPVNAMASYPSTLSHDFSKGPAIVPVHVTLRNQMLESSVKFFVSSVDENLGFELIGLDVLLLSLEPSEDIDIPFEVLIPEPGIHNLQALKLTIRHKDQDLSYPLEQQWLLHVTDNISPPRKQ